jgi:hypothetical protein
VRALAVEGQDNIYVGGDLGNVGGASRRGTAKLSGIDSGQADPQWNPSITGGANRRVLDLTTLRTALTSSSTTSSPAV